MTNRHRGGCQCALIAFRSPCARKLIVVQPPEDAIETGTATIWLEDGIIFERFKGAPATSESTTKVFDVIRDLCEGSPRPFLLDARIWWGGAQEAWGTAVKELTSTFSAVAMLVEPEVAAKIGPFPDSINRLLIPFQVFTDEAEALAFVRSFLPSE